MAGEDAEKQVRRRLTDTDVSEEALDFLDWYRNLWQRENGVPRRSLVDPVDIPTLLPWLWIYDRDQNSNYVCRFAGERIDLRWGKTSVQFQELSKILPPERLGPVVTRIEHCLNHRCIAHGWTNATDPAARRRVERCFAPIADNNGRPDGVVGVALYGNAYGTALAYAAPRSVARLGLYDPATLELRLEID